MSLFATQPPRPEARMQRLAAGVLAIGAYLVVGPYFALGWVPKGIELAIVGLVAVDLLAEGTA